MNRIPITTERLTVRRLESGDLDAFIQFMLDEESTRYLAFAPEQKTADGAKALFDEVVHSYDTTEPVHAYAIADRATGEYLGSCGFAPYESGVVECYYTIHREHRGRGVATEATRALIAALATHTEVRAYCHPENPAAHAVARKCGMQHRGRVRHANSGLEGEEFVFARN